MMCGYCNKRPAVNQDHVIPKSVYKRFQRMWVKVSATRRMPRYVTAAGEVVRESLLETEPACHPCNVAKGARLLVPPSWADRLDALNDLHIGVFRVWDGSPEALRVVVK